jgi:hypothetical protein
MASGPPKQHAAKFGNASRRAMTASALFMTCLRMLSRVRERQISRFQSPCDFLCSNASAASGFALVAILHREINLAPFRTPCVFKPGYSHNISFLLALNRCLSAEGKLRAFFARAMCKSWRGEGPLR